MLREVQSALGASLLADFHAPPPEGVIAGDQARAAARFAIHRGTVLESLVNALGAAFPVAKKIAGDHNFRVLAGNYVRARPPRRPQLSDYGGDLADFAAGFPAALGDLPFLPDLLRLEWALHDSYFAADGPLLSPEALGAVDPERLPGARLALQPAARIVVSPEFPIWTIWQAEIAPPAPIEPGEAVLVTRPAGRVEAYQLAPGEAAFLRAIDAGADLENAADRAFAANSGFDFAAALAASLARGVFGAGIKLT